MPDETKAGVVVVGSINMDLVVRAPAIPRPGETVLGDELQMFPGGKGANQAVGVARLGTPCRMVGRVGADDFGHRMREALRAGGVDVDYAQPTPDTATGTALIVLSAAGENAICVAGGANRCLAPADVDAAADAISSAAVCLLQLEIPPDTVRYTIGRCREWGVMTVLDAAPAAANPPDWLFDVDVLTANRSEAALLTGREADTTDDPRTLAAALHERGAKHVVLKLGAGGAWASDGRREVALAPHKVRVVDTTAAGDAFNAALGARLAAGADLFDAARYANAAGALACTVMGAFPSMPTAEMLLPWE
jgi:ribokinase